MLPLQGEIAFAGFFPQPVWLGYAMLARWAGRKPRTDSTSRAAGISTLRRCSVQADSLQVHPYGTYMDNYLLLVNWGNIGVFSWFLM
jgi:hypothetical protein